MTDFQKSADIEASCEVTAGASCEVGTTLADWIKATPVGFLEVITEVDLGPPLMMYADGRIEEYESNSVRIRLKRTRKGPGKCWVISDGNYVLNKNGEWEFDSLPSERSDSFKDQTRFDSAVEAVSFYQEWKISAKVKGL